MVHKRKPRRRYNEIFAEKQAEKRKHVAPASKQSVGDPGHGARMQKLLEKMPKDKLTALIQHGWSEEEWEYKMRPYAKFNTKHLTRGKHGSAGQCGTA